MTTTPPHDLADGLANAVARQLIPRLDRIAARAMADPEPSPPPCGRCAKPAPWRAYVAYFPTDAATEVHTAQVALCSHHADRYHRAHRQRRLLYQQRPVIRLTLTQRA